MITTFNNKKFTMSYRTVKKAYKRTFGKADYVRDTTTRKVKVEPDNVVYVKTESPINKAITALLMKKALYERKPIPAEEIDKFSTLLTHDEPVIKLNAEDHDWRLKLMLKFGYRPINLA